MVEKNAPPPSPHPRPCHESVGQGKFLLALVGPESHDFNLQEVTEVRSGRRTRGAVLDRGSSQPEHPHPPPPSPSHLASLDALGAALNPTTEVPL